MKFKIGKILIYVVALFWSFMTIFPLFVTFLSSVKDNEGITLGMFTWPETWLWSNYITAFQSGGIGRAVVNSTIMSLLSTVVVIIFGMAASYVLSRKVFKFKKLIFSLFIVGVMVPVHTTIIPIANLASRFNGRNTYWFIILVYAAFNLAQGIFLFTGYLNGVDKELDEAAIMDGCNDFQILFKILFPISIPIISTVSILTFIFGYGELIFSMILLTDESRFTIARAMLTFQGGYQNQLGPIFASIVVAVLPMIVLYIIFHERVQAGMMAGAVKG